MSTVSDILNRMEQLKKWQVEQERVVMQHHERIQANESGISNNLVITSNHSRPIIPQTPNELESVDSKSKRPFLRRGSGLSRFKMAPGEQFKIKSRRSLQTPEAAILYTPEQRATSMARWIDSEKSDDPSLSLLSFEEMERKLKETSICGNSKHTLNTPNEKLPFELPVVKEWKPPDDFHDIKEMNDKIIQENKKQMEDFEQAEKRLHDELVSSLQQAMRFKEMLKQDKAGGRSTPLSTSSEEIRDFEDTEKWDSNSNMSSSVSSSEILNSTIKFEVGTMTDDVQVVEELGTKMEQLQLELKSVRDNSIEVKRLKVELEQERRELDKQKRELLKQEKEDKDNVARANSLLDLERKKLVKEKMVFEKYIKDSQNKPNRKEREEISLLREELAALKETYKLKEVRNSTSHARLRNQIKSLENENVNLKAEIEKLLKENGRLIASQRLNKKPSDTKLLHEISKSITKLAQEQNKKEKENDKNASNSSENDCETNNNNILSTLPLRHDTFRLHNDTLLQSSKISNRIEETLSDGSRVITYSNGDTKTVSGDGNVVTFNYYNGDVKTRNLLEGTICYYYAENKTSQITKADGTEIFKYPDGVTETRLTDGSSEKIFPNGITVIQNDQGDKTLLLPNGQKEIHTKDHKRREYPDGTVKLLYPDGKQKTNYSNGRVRIKDKDGILLFDSMA